MTLRRRKFLHLAAGAAALPYVSRIARAETFPSRPITIIVPFPAGGPVDTLARILTEPMRVSLGQPLIIENVSGAGGTIGAARVARAAPDGYTIMLGNWTSSVGSPAIYPIQFDAVKDFEPVSLLAFSPLMIVAKANLPANSVQELIAWLKANPNKATAGTIGVGSPSHVGALYFQSLTGTRFQVVPYRGAAPALQDLLAGQIDLRVGAEGSQMLPHLHNHTVKGLAIMGKTRWSATPDIPTIDEAGLPGLYLTFWQGFSVPKATPQDIVAKLNAAAVDALADPAAHRRLIDLGQDIPPREQQTPEAFGAFHKAEIEKWWPIIKAANIKVE
jgi:tripartite-type tricarboxylate transporter receptor subunit TctC